MKIDMYYDRPFRSWVIRILDSEGNQIGDCDYAYTKAEAKQCGKEMLEDLLKEKADGHV